MQVVMVTSAMVLPRFILPFPVSPASPPYLSYSVFPLSYSYFLPLFYFFFYFILLSSLLHSDVLSFPLLCSFSSFPNSFFPSIRHSFPLLTHPLYHFFLSRFFPFVLPSIFFFISFIHSLIPSLSQFPFFYPSFFSICIYFPYFSSPPLILS